MTQLHWSHDAPPAISQAILDNLAYRAYVHQRESYPQVTPERWAQIFDDAPQLEARYQAEKVARLVPLVLGDDTTIIPLGRSTVVVSITEEY